ncbi:MAG TPA: RiPP maturation radical SAM C-methyltransferase [Acidobacteriota bacterium]|nr:RiPP maturation radical SAM C-methyltransferase [Acidobacteriota bacterium]
MPKYDFKDILQPNDALIIVPPFAGLDRPSLGSHVLQACAKEAGFRVSVLYANLLLAEHIGDLLYSAICYAPMAGFLGERFWARSAYGVPPLGRKMDFDWDVYWQDSVQHPDLKFTLDKYKELESKAEPWAEAIADAVAEIGFKFVGATTTFEQTAASVALLNRIKERSPETVTLLGGANCEGEMGHGILSLKASIDYIFSGESEVTFPEFLQAASEERLPEEPIIQGKPCMDLDSVPITDFSEFYSQYESFLSNESVVKKDRKNNVWLPYEASRGCWWGAKHHCTFCGINGGTLTFREKSPDVVISQLNQLLEKHPTNRVCMVDNIMPYTFFKSLIPRMPEEVSDVHMFYEQKANLSLDQVRSLKEAGVAVIQPGIEALSSSLLRRMDKGVKAKQNIALLRYARSVRLGVNWNLLFGFPGDKKSDYLETMALFPFLSHLQPPNGFYRLSLDRFSPYHSNSEKYGITRKYPWPGLEEFLPEGADAMKISYHFFGDYQSDAMSNRDLMVEIRNEIRKWQEKWNQPEQPRPLLEVTPLSREYYMLMDTRPLEDQRQVQFFNWEQTIDLLTEHPLSRKDELQWMLDSNLAVIVDERIVPLATASASLIEAAEQMARRRQRSLDVVLPIIQSERSEYVA